MTLTLVDADTLARHLDDPGWVVVDCRFSLADPDEGRRDFLASRIPDARYAHLEHDLSGPVVPGVTGRHPLPERAALATFFGAIGIATDSTIVAHDGRAGPMAARLWWLARWLGHARVAVLDGGFAAWRAAGLPLETGAPATDSPPGDFRAGTPLVASVGIEAVAAGDLALLDAREHARFVGAHEPIDPVAGHIPGARNHPFTDNLDADGRFLSPATLRERFAGALGTPSGTPSGALPDAPSGVSSGALPAGDGSGDPPGDPPPGDPPVADVRPLAHYCGSGVTAAHNVLAMAHAGLEPGALYVGSFSEWITCHAAATGEARER